MLRKLLIAGALAALVAAAAASAGRSRGGQAPTTVETSLLMPGVGYTREVDFTPRGPVVLDVVTAPRPDGTLYTLAPVLSNETSVGTEPLTALEQRLSANATVVGVNGDYFDSATGAPSGILARGGTLDAMPNAKRSSLGIAADGTLTVSRISYKGSWQGSGERRSLDLNAAPAKGHATLYTPAYGPTTPAESGVVELVFGSFPAAVAGQPLDGTVGQVGTGGPAAIPPGGAVLVARGAQAKAALADAPVGQRVEVRLTLTPAASLAPSLLGGGPLLVRKGKPVFDAHEAFGASLVSSRTARSAVGQLSDGRILLVTAEGGGPAYSLGMTSYELAVALARLGAVTAVGLGSGAQAGMAFDGTLLTRPAGTEEAPVSDALVLSYLGVYAAEPAAAVLSPNGDGANDAQTFTYKLVRPSHVAAALAGPGGAALTLAADDEQPGVHTLTWNGENADGTPAAEGAWRFTVTATDDQGRTTSAERGFALDDTLGALVATPATATFQLTREAQVVVTVERRNGVVVATPLQETLEPGPQTVAWDGRGATGKPAPAGGYQFRVQATSEIGHSDLVAPFTVGSRLRH